MLQVASADIEVRREEAAGASMNRFNREFSPKISNVHYDAMENLRFFKRQQWMITNYIGIIDGATFALSHTIDPNIIWILYVIVLFNTIGGIFLIFVMQRSIGNHRRRLASIYANYYSQHERTSLRISAAPKPRLFDWEVLIALISVALAGGLLTILALLPSPQLRTTDDESADVSFVVSISSAEPTRIRHH